MSWTIEEAKDAAKAIDKAPKHIQKAYEFWQSIIRISGPDALRAMHGFNDEALSGQWKGYRASRLSGQWRVIYRADRGKLVVYVVRIIPHDYRK